MNNVTRVGCLAHLRRNFTDAEAALKKQGRNSPTVTTAIAYCSRVFKIEEELADLSCEERHKQRLTRVKPVLEEFFDWAETRHAAPKSKLGEALTYTHNQKQFIIFSYWTGIWKQVTILRNEVSSLLSSAERISCLLTLQPALRAAQSPSVS